MTEQSGAYERPTYPPGLLPAAPSGTGLDRVPCCSLCGVVVVNPVAHDEWHAALWVALSASGSSQP